MKHPLALLAAAIVVLPFVVRPVIAAEIWLFAIFGLGLNLILGYTGLLSFGQAGFFAVGAYGCGKILLAVPNLEAITASPPLFDDGLGDLALLVAHEPDPQIGVGRSDPADELAFCRPPRHNGGDPRFAPLD